MKEDTSETVEFAIKLQDAFPIDSHWPVEKYKAIDDAFNANDKDAQAEARKDLATAFRLKAKAVNMKYIAPPKSTDLQLSTFQQKDFLQSCQVTEIKNKRTVTSRIKNKVQNYNFRTKYFIRTLQSYHLGFQTLKVQQHATQIYSDLRNISKI